MDVPTLISQITPLTAPDPVRDVLHGALADGDWLDERYLRRETDREWALHPLHRSGRCSIVVAVFRPGAAAPIHDHGTWAVIGIYRGRERETWFRHTDSGLAEVRSFVNPTGAVSVVPTGMIHTVQALDDQDAVSLHVYGTDIVTQERSMFDLDGRAQPYRPTFE
jgi:3-mercaptopropionate dioxygenase